MRGTEKMKMKCDNCESVFFREEDLAHVYPDIPRLAERIAPGETVPAGECPNCGALVHLGNDATLTCSICGDAVAEADLREHLRQHNPNATGMDWEDVRNAFALVPEGAIADVEPDTTTPSSGPRGFRPLACPACDGDGRMAQIDLIPGYAVIAGLYEDGTIEWDGYTEVDWNMQRAEDNPPQYICMSCSSVFTAKELGVKV